MKISSVSVFCGSSDRIDQHYLSLAFHCGAMLVKNNIRLIYGGGRLGMMGQVSNGCLSENGDAYGITTDYLEDTESAHRGLSKLDIVPDMHTRKIRMFEHSDAIIILPGGFGTLDEAMEVLTWRQLGLHNKPIIAVNYEGYWDTLIALIHHISNKKFATPEQAQLIRFVDSIEEIMPILRESPA